MFPIIVCRYKKYEDYHTSCVSQWSALRSRWYTLASGHKARLLALVKAEVPDPNKLLQAITKMEGAEELVVEELAQVKAKFVELVEGAQSEMEAMANSEHASYDDLMVVMRKYEDYPHAVDSRTRIAACLSFVSGLRGRFVCFVPASPHVFHHHRMVAGTRTIRSRTSPRCASTCSGAWTRKATRSRSA